MKKSGTLVIDNKHNQIVLMKQIQVMYNFYMEMYKDKKDAPEPAYLELSQVVISLVSQR